MMAVIKGILLFACLSPEVVNAGVGSDIYYVDRKLLFKFHILYEFQCSDWLICTKRHGVVTKQPPWCHYRGVITMV